jgi:hypothetical protein
MDFLLKNEDDFTAFDRMKFEAMRYTMSKLPRPGAPQAAPLAAGAIRDDGLLTRARLSQCTRRSSIRVFSNTRFRCAVSATS